MTFLESEDTGKSNLPDPVDDKNQELYGCIPNISKRERKKRLLIGLVTLTISLLVLALLMTFGADRGWRLVTFFFFFGATVGFFQWRDKT